MTDAIIVYTAVPAEYKEVCLLLSKEKLPIDDLSKQLQHFLVVKDSGTVIGVIGLEVYETDGLLRSMATDQTYRNRGIAAALVDELLQYSKRLGLSSVFLLTETAEDYFSKKQFSRINRDQAPESIRQSSEFSHVCPSSAALMKKEIQ